MKKFIEPKMSGKAFKEHIQSIVSRPVIALIEIIANASDAGAENLFITWPKSEGEFATFKDDGEGMSNSEFKKIWPELSYNRIADNRDKISYPLNRKGFREIYGKNGKGRHSPFSFSNKYLVKTVKNKELSEFKILKDSRFGFTIQEENHEQNQDLNNGTEISFKINNNYLSEEDIKSEIASRFLKDPSFNIFLNDNLVELNDINENYIKIFNCYFNDIKIPIIQIKSKFSSKTIKYHGISWQIGKRLIFDDHWKNVADGRRTNSKKYTYIVKADILKDEVNELMDGFNETEKVKKVRKNVFNCIKKNIHEEDEEYLNSQKKEIVLNHLDDVSRLSDIDKQDIGDFITNIQIQCPSISKSDLDATTEIFISMKQSHSGFELLHKLSKINPEDIDSLNEILDEWDIKDAKTVLDEIGLRLKLVNELKRKV